MLSSKTITKTLSKIALIPDFTLILLLFLLISTSGNPKRSGWVYSCLWNGRGAGSQIWKFLSSLWMSSRKWRRPPLLECLHKPTPSQHSISFWRSQSHISTCDCICWWLCFPLQWSSYNWSYVLWGRSSVMELAWSCPSPNVVWLGMIMLFLRLPIHLFGLRFLWLVPVVTLIWGDKSPFPPRTLTTSLLKKLSMMSDSL